MKYLLFTLFFFPLFSFSQNAVDIEEILSSSTTNNFILGTITKVSDMLTRSEIDSLRFKANSVFSVGGSKNHEVVIIEFKGEKSFKIKSDSSGAQLIKEIYGNEEPPKGIPNRLVKKYVLGYFPFNNKKKNLKTVTKYLDGTRVLLRVIETGQGSHKGYLLDEKIHILDIYPFKKEYLNKLTEL